MKKVFKSKAYKDKLKGHKDGLIKVFAPDGPESAMLLSASKDGCVRAWDLKERKIAMKLLLSREGSVDGAQTNNRLQGDDDISDDEQDTRILSGGQSGSVRKEWLAAVSFSKSAVFGGFNDGMIFGWSLQSGAITTQLKGHSKPITELEFINEKQLVSASHDATIRIWDVQMGVNETILHMPGGVDLMKINKNSIQAVVEKNTFVEINLTTLEVTNSVRFMGTSITSFVSIDSQLIIATTDNLLEVYSLDALTSENLQPTYIVDINKDWVLCMKVFNGYLFTGSDDRRIKVWNTRSKLTLVEDFVGHEDGVVCLDFADNNMLYSGSFDHSIRSWNLSEMEQQIHERAIMFREDVWSRKYDAWYKVFFKNKKKKATKKASKK